MWKIFRRSRLPSTIVERSKFGRLDLVWTVNMLHEKFERLIWYISQAKSERQEGFCWRPIQDFDSCKIPRQLQRCVFQSLGCASSKQPCLTAAPNLGYVHWTLVLESKVHQDCKLWDCVLETCFRSDARGNPTRPSGKRHLLSHFIEHMSFDMVDHVPRNTPESSFPDSAFSPTTRSPNLRHGSRTHRVDLAWLFERNFHSICDHR